MIRNLPYIYVFDVKAINYVIKNIHDLISTMTAEGNSI